MKKVIFIIVTLGILVSCTKNEETNTELLGDWKLIEVYSDPGDGSGTFAPVCSEKTITFKRNGKITSNGNLCDMSLSSDKKTTGTFSQSLSFYTSDDCTDLQEYPFERNGNILIITYPCFEGCQSKYLKE